MKIKELLDTKEKWTTCALARTSHKKSTYEFDEAAVSWCLLGACNKCYNDDDDDNFDNMYQKIRDYILEKYSISSISEWNDSKATFNDIRELVETLDI